MNRAMTGIRPTGDLTIANYLGAMEPIVDMQQSFDGPVSIFVADVHGLTTEEPDVINRNRIDTARSLMAAGIDTDRTTIYLQSQVEEPTLAVANILGRHVTVAELSRVPTLKEKLKGAGTETASLALFTYPLMMAADIVVQDATHVPVGKDQEPHVEFTRDAVRRFNNQYGNGEEVFIKPELMTSEGLRILALNGDGKMSKSVPNGAIFLKDKPDDVARKIKKAQTASPGEMTEVLASHFTLTRALTPAEGLGELDNLQKEHEEGKLVLGAFKPLMTDRINTFLARFQEHYDSISDEEVVDVLREGGARSMDQANGVHNRAKKAMGFVDLFASFEAPAGR